MTLTIHTPTYDLAQKVVARLIEMGYKWRYGPTTKERLYWFDCKEHSTYEIEHGFIVIGHRGRPNPGNAVIDAKEFLKLQIERV